MLYMSDIRLDTTIHTGIAEPLCMAPGIITGPGTEPIIIRVLLPMVSGYIIILSQAGDFLSGSATDGSGTGITGLTTILPGGAPADTGTVTGMATTMASTGDTTGDIIADTGTAFMRAAGPAMLQATGMDAITSPARMYTGVQGPGM